MIDEKKMANLLNSMKNPIAFTDTKHIIRYLNDAALKHYDEGEQLLGTSLLACHNEQSGKMILEIFEEMKNGLDERMITDNEKHRIYMRAVRDEKGNLVGYYERYEPPAKK